MFNRNLHVHVLIFNNKTQIICHIGTIRCWKNVCLAFSLVNISFSKNLVYPVHAEFLDLLVSVNIHVIKIITWNLPDLWDIIFSSDPPNILLCVGIGIGYKIKVKLKFCTQPMHQIYVIKYCILLKNSSSE